MVAGRYCSLCSNGVVSPQPIPESTKTGIPMVVPNTFEVYCCLLREVHNRTPEDRMFLRPSLAWSVATNVNNATEFRTENNNGQLPQSLSRAPGSKINKEIVDCTQ